MTLPAPVTLDEARNNLRSIIDKGAYCPCCNQFAKVYRNRMTSAMANGLIRIYRHAGTDFTYLPDLFGAQADGRRTKTSWWGLLEKMPGARDDGSNRNGWWRVTEDGERFVNQELSVPAYAVTYNGQTLKLDGDFVEITDVLGSKFNYSELMAGV